MSTLRDVLQSQQWTTDPVFESILSFADSASTVKVVYTVWSDERTNLYVTLGRDIDTHQLSLFDGILIRLGIGSFTVGLITVDGNQRLDLLFGKASVWLSKELLTAIGTAPPATDDVCLCELEGHLSLDTDWRAKVEGIFTIKQQQLAFGIGNVKVSVKDIQPDLPQGTLPSDVAAFLETDVFLTARLEVLAKGTLGDIGIPGFRIRLGEDDTFNTLSLLLLISKEFGVFLQDPVLQIDLPTSLFTPMKETGEGWVPAMDKDGKKRSARINVSAGSLAWSTNKGFGLFGSPKLEIEPIGIGNSGIVIRCNGLRSCLTDFDPLPTEVPAGSRGFAIDTVDVYLPDSIKGIGIDEIEGQGLFLGSGGFTGEISLKSSAKDKTIHLAGIECTVKSLLFSIKQNSLVEAGLTCQLKLPYFDQPVQLDISFSNDGSLLASLSATQPSGVESDNGLIHFKKDNLFNVTIEGVSFELKGGVSILKVSAELQPTFQPKGGKKELEWPSFKVQELSIDSNGHVKFDGGWMDLPDQCALDFHGFKLEITKLGFGKTDDGGKWIGFSGGLKLVDGFTAGASVEGLRLTWYGDGSEPKISFNGIGVEFEIPDVVHFKGEVSYRELEVNGESVRRFDGDIELELISLKLKIDAKLVIGSAITHDGNKYTFFAIYLGVELPTGIPLSPTPLALYGMAGLFALRMEPDKKPDEEWYDGWYKRKEIGVTDLKDKWVNRRGSLALGGGVTIGTASDNGFTFACKAVLVIVFPGPIVMIEGKANLLKERAELDDDPMFRSLAVIDGRQGQILVGLDAKYKCDEQDGNVIDIRAGVEAYFHTPSDWHIYVGEKEPREKRISADIFKLFQANSYFMIDQDMLQTGVWVGYDKQWKFGPLSLSMEAWIEGNAKVNWRPLHFHGDLWLHGSIEAGLFGFEIGLSADARFEADVFDPFHVLASFEVTVKVPKPFKSKSVDLILEWGPKPEWPKQLPLPLQEIAIEHFKVTTSWPLPKNELLLPNYDEGNGMRGYTNPLKAITQVNEPPPSDLPVVPIDCRPHISFGRSVHDDALIGVNPQPVQPEFERIGDPKQGPEGQGPVKVRYGLTEIALHKWNGSAWDLVARKSKEATNVGSLFGSWAPIPQLPMGTGEMPVANVKLWLWSRTPFDYTRHGGSGWDDWFTGNENFADYPCVPQDIPDREVCCNFERLNSTQELASPWKIPDPPEFTLTWLAPQKQKVEVLEPPVKGYTHALCFPAKTVLPGGIGRPRLISNVVSVNLSAPAKQVRLVVGEGKKAERVCLSFRNRGIKAIPVDLPLVEQGISIQVQAMPPTQPPKTKIFPLPTTIGDLTGLDCGTVAIISLPCGATNIELMLTPLIPKVSVVALNSNGVEVIIKQTQNPVTQPEVLRFEGSDLRKIKITSQVPAGSATGGVFLHEVCFLCPDTTPNVTATGLNKDGKPVGKVVQKGGVIEITGQGLSQVQLTGKTEICLMEICALFGPDPLEITQRQDMLTHLKDELAHWGNEGEVLEPNTTYRLKVETKIDARGEGELSGYPPPKPMPLTQVEFAYFRTEGPPGLTTLSVPVGRSAKNFDSGLDDLTRYVRQTIPATVPAPGQKPVMAKPFYRAYDVSVDFNENYVDLMYRISRRDLGLYLYDSNNRPVRDAEGRLLVQSGDWKHVEDLTLTEGEQRWLNLVNKHEPKQDCDLPPIIETSVKKDKKLLSAFAGRVLEPDTIYEARLIPLLLHEDFRDYALSTPVQGPTGKLGRWAVRDDGTTSAPSKWEVRIVGTPPNSSQYLAQTSGIKGGQDDPGTSLWYTDDSSLDKDHPDPDQPTQWTDYRMSAYLRTSGSGAMGVIFRRSDDNNYYRFSMDRKRKFRRLVRVVGGVHKMLSEDNFAYQPSRDYLITVEAIGESLRVYQDGALVFEITDTSHPKGSIGLYCYDNQGARFSDVRVDDFRQPVKDDKPQKEESRPKTDKTVYRFQFTTSLFANFAHHLHSYQDETWLAAISNGPGVIPALDKAVLATVPPSDDEARAYETLATAVLGQAARQNPREVQVTRVDIEGASLAFLVQSPEPLDWSRLSLTCWRSGLFLPAPSLPRAVKLTGAAIAANNTELDSVTLLLREAANLAGCRLESRVVMWPLTPISQTGAGSQNVVSKPVSTSEWITYNTFGIGKTLPAGSSLQINPSGSGTQTQVMQQAGRPIGRPGPSLFATPSIEVRLVAPNGEVVHARHFLPENNYSLEDMVVLRKADGTGFFLARREGKLSIGSLSLGQYHLKLIYRRDMSKVIPGSLIYSEAGDRSDETVFIDVPWQTH